MFSGSSAAGCISSKRSCDRSSSNWSPVSLASIMRRPPKPKSSKVSHCLAPAPPSLRGRNSTCRRVSDADGAHLLRHLAAVGTAVLAPHIHGRVTGAQRDLGPVVGLDGQDAGPALHPHLGVDLLDDRLSGVWASGERRRRRRRSVSLRTVGRPHDGLGRASILGEVHLHCSFGHGWLQAGAWAEETCQEKKTAPPPRDRLLVRGTRVQPRRSLTAARRGGGDQAGSKREKKPDGKSSSARVLARVMRPRHTPTTGEKAEARRHTYLSWAGRVASRREIANGARGAAAHAMDGPLHLSAQGSWSKKMSTMHSPHYALSRWPCGRGTLRTRAAPGDLGKSRPAPEACGNACTRSTASASVGRHSESTCHPP